MAQQPMPKYVYKIDMSKIQTIEDIKLILSMMDLETASFKEDESDMTPVKHLLGQKRKIELKLKPVVPDIIIPGR
jgi:hypothetical protein